MIMQVIFRKFLAQKTHDLSHDLRHENLSMKFEWYKIFTLGNV